MAAVGRFLGQVVDRVLASPVGSKSKEIQRAGQLAKRVSDTIANDKSNGMTIDTQAARDALRAVGMGGSTGMRIEDIHQEALEAALSEKAFLPSSVLFVPLNNVKALKKVVTIAADAFILDLEDAVAPNKKDEARSNLIDLCRDGVFANKRIYVRINSPRETPHIGMADLDACGLVSKFIHGICIPKTEHADIDIIDGALHDDTPLWAFIETARGLHQVERVLNSKRFAAVVLGSNDLATELGLPRLTPAQQLIVPPRFGLQYAHSKVIAAARAAGIPVIDGVFNDHSDPAGLQRDCLFGQALGFDGKSLIHPAQVPICNTCFDPSPEQQVWATKVVSAVAVAGGGATVCDGEMVEEMHARRAKTVLKRAAMVSTRHVVIESTIPKEREFQEAKMRFLTKMVGENAPEHELMPGLDDDPKHRKRARDELKFTAKDDDVSAEEFDEPKESGRRLLKPEAVPTRAPTPTTTSSSNSTAETTATRDAAAEAEVDDVASQSELDRAEARDSRRTPRGAVPKRSGPRNFKLVKEEEFYPNLDDTLHVRFRP